MHFPIEPKLLAISFEPYTLQVNLVDFLVLISLFFLSFSFLLVLIKTLESYILSGERI